VSQHNRQARLMAALPNHRPNSDCRLSPGPMLAYGFDTAEPHIRSPLTAADTKIPHTRGRRARKGGTILYRGKGLLELLRPVLSPSARGQNHSRPLRLTL
jgi:hypothetical protein